MSAIASPDNLKDATRLLERYARLDGQLAGVEAMRRQSIAAANASADKAAGPLIEKLDALKTAIEPWWKAAAPELAKGRKSIQLGGCKIGYQTGSPRLTHTFTDDDVAIAALKYSRYYRQTTKATVSLDRKAALKLIDAGGKPAEVLATLGFGMVQEEAFILKRVEQEATIKP